ncbi:MAG: hypothetical protein IRY87_03515 [Acetobacteraceae bacterium]|nr:hypothetical protein [Acetobacteraceae bacterium]
MDRRWFLAGGVALPLVWTAGARAQGGGHGHAHSGQEQKIGRYEVELMVRAAEAVLLVRDERDQPVDAAPLGATAVVLARGNERRTMEFRPAGGNRLVAPVDFPFDGKFRATVTLRGPAGDLGTGRFNVDPAR